MKTERHYSAKEIRVLEGLEAVRVRPAMYIGGTNADGLHHLVYEVVDNSIDEALAGVCDTIKVVIHKDGSLSVEDNGSGIPVDTHPQTGVSTVETVLTVLHAGGKFDNSAYEYSGGLHGVGISVVNALSKNLTAQIRRNGHIYRQSYAEGKPTTKLEVIGENDNNTTGTKIRFLPDDTIFETVNFKYETLQKRFREMAFLNKGVKIVLEDERTNKKENFHYEGGITSFVEFLNKNKTPIHSNIISFSDSKEGVTVELSMQYTDGYSENTLTFANNISTKEGGTHLSGLRTALTRVMNDYGRKFNHIKEKEENLSGDDVREGLTSILSVKLPDPQFEGQTKGKLGNSEVRGIVESLCYEFLNNYLEKNPKVGKTIITKAVCSQRARNASRKARELTRRKNAFDAISLPTKLADCQSRDIKETEIYLVEGE